MIAKIKPIIWVLLTAFLVRLMLEIMAFILAKDLKIFQAGDTASYLKPAHDLVSYGRFTSNGFPEIFRVPRYSITIQASNYAYYLYSGWVWGVFYCGKF